MKRRKRRRSQMRNRFVDLPPSIFEQIASFCDTRSALNLLRVCKDLNYKLIFHSPGFWRELCVKESFTDYSSIRSLDSNESGVCFDGRRLRDLEIPSNVPLWRKIFLRGTAMRRNICAGKFKLWRLFLTDEDHLPVKEMSSVTTFRELRSSHRKSPFNRPDRRSVRINRYWNESYLVTIQKLDRVFCDIFVWKWKECQNPEFLFTRDFKETYPNGAFPTAFFVHDQYLVLTPQASKGVESVRSVIRAHDLSRNADLIGFYDFPESGPYRRYIPVSAGGTEAAHLHKVNDTAVSLCRTPDWTVLLFRIPDCTLLRITALGPLLNTDLESRILDQRFLLRNRTMMFTFHDSEFYSFDSTRKAFGQLLVLELNDVDISARLDETFDDNDDCLEKITAVSENRLICVRLSGTIVIRDLVQITEQGRLMSVDRVTIPCPSSLLDDDVIETDGPFLATSRSGHRIAVLRHFTDGRKIHCYSGDGDCLFEIALDKTRIQKEPGYVSVDMDGNFLCAADMDKILLWNSETGDFIRALEIPKHYNVMRDVFKTASDKFCWKGHTDFVFAEDGIVLVHSQRHFPIAADILSFW